jgi:hypothetical protein
VKNVFTSTRLGTLLVYRKKLCPFYTITIPTEAGSLQQSQQLCLDTSQKVSTGLNSYGIFTFYCLHVLATDFV